MGARREGRVCGSGKLLDSSGYPEQVKEKKAMTLNTQSRVSLNTHNRTVVNEVVTLEIDKNGSVSRALPDPSMKSMTLENTLLRQLYPDIRVATANVPTDPLNPCDHPH